MPNQRKPPKEPIDLDKIREQFLVVCGMHDYGIPEYGCSCPPEFRGVLQDLIEEIEFLRKDNVAMKSWIEHEGWR